MKKIFAVGALFALLTLTGCYQKVESVATTSPSFDEVFTSRRSVRTGGIWMRL